MALIDRSESMHKKSVAWLQEFEGTIYTTEAVLTEVLYLLSFSQMAQESALDFVIDSAVIMVPSNIESLGITKRLMKKYSDLPMDFADATIVALAMDTDINNIATFDRKDFSIYKFSKTQSFNVISF